MRKQTKNKISRVRFQDRATLVFKIEMTTYRIPDLIVQVEVGVEENGGNV
jgi:LytS/YehU family sensor histidine kinase